MQAAESEQAKPAEREAATTEAAGAAAAFDEDQEYDDEEGSEEEDSSSDSDADRREFGIYQALPVEEGEPDWEAECLDVQEYLRRVRYEAEHLPDVVTAAPPSQQTAADAPNPQRDRPTSFDRFLAADPGVAPCDPSLKPSAAWTLDFLRQFSQLRRRLQREFELTCGQPAAGADLGGGLRISPEAAAGSGALEAAAQEELAALSLDPPSALTPELQQLQGQDQLQVRRQLHAAIRQVVREEQLDPAAAALLYALSARIEKPLHAGTCALYRQLLRLCASQRAALGSAADPSLPHLNIMIVIAGAYFAQDEELATMWDDDE
ncbi:Gem-associated 2 [Chlorella sorokiniana]|uniref:Gem-associated 2 n=1 Tax=Chlorella sorokiniana TaxID=3076 RepID=A0A2P6TQY4_CHLSO|nr:Gem-associated 2 [Chlorella sorokiniana]|eukprot:PRW56469.1 Gem-associated 2 [Chlorella sorokiniana]